MPAQKLYVFAGRSGGGKTTIIRRLFPGILVVDVIQFVIPLQENGNVSEEAAMTGYTQMYRLMAGVSEDVAVLELGTSHPEFNVHQLLELQARFDISVYLCTTRPETSRERIGARGLRGFNTADSDRRLFRDFPNIYVEPLKHSGLPYELVDMEGGMAETLQSFSRILGRAVTDGAHTPRYLGVVARGARRAGALGFPTLNIVLPDLHLSGVYAARVEIGGQTRDAAAFADPSRNVLEAHLLDFSENVPAGTPITIELFEKMRDSEKFNNDEALKSAIASDISDIKKYFVTHLQP